MILAATRDAARLFLELGTVTVVLAVGARFAARTGFSSIPLSKAIRVCSTGKGLRCAPAAAPTTPSVRCSGLVFDDVAKTDDAIARNTCKSRADARIRPRTPSLREKCSG